MIKKLKEDLNKESMKENGAMMSMNNSLKVSDYMARTGIRFESTSVQGLVHKLDLMHKNSSGSLRSKMI